LIEAAVWQFFGFVPTRFVTGARKQVYEARHRFFVGRANPAKLVGTTEHGSLLERKHRYK